MNVIKQVSEILPISHISIERVAFDFQKLENMDIRKWEYGNGPLFGYKDYKDYINDIQDCKCLLCGKNPIQYYHHIKKRSDGGSNKISNLVGLCWDCHYGPKGVHNCQETEDKLIVMKSTMNSQYKVSLLATDQKVDSLEEFLIAYRKTHTEKEVQQMMHQVVIKPAKRTYTSKRKFANKYKINQHEMRFPSERFPHETFPHERFHSGDTILYKKHNRTKGNTKKQIFVCTDVSMSNNKVSYGTKNRLMKLCKVIKSGCTPFMNYRIFK